MSYSKSKTISKGPLFALLISTLASLLVALTFCIGATQEAFSQDRKDTRYSEPTYSLSLAGEPLSKALDVLIDQTDINLFYESELVEGKHVFCSIENRPIEDLLRCILRRTELDFYQLSSGMYVLIDRPRAEAKFGNLAGLVIDAYTGEPLPDAAVMLAYAETGTATNMDGRFALGRLTPGMHPVFVTHVAYENLYDSLYVSPDEETFVRLLLNPRTIVATPIIVDGLQERLPSERLASQKLDTEDLLINPTHTPSTHQALNSIVGVRGGEAFSDMHVQGSDSGEHLYTLDGAPVFVPLRNGGFFSAFSPLALSKITVHKAGFGASEGSYLAGVIDIDHELASSKESLLDIHIDALSANGRLQGSINTFENIGLSWMVAGRTSLWKVLQPGPIEQQLRSWSQPNAFIYNSLVPGAISNPTGSTSEPPLNIEFTDLHVASRLRLGTSRSLYFSMYLGNNAFGQQRIPTDQFFDESESEDYSWSNKMWQARYEWVLGHKTFLSVGVWSSDYRLIHPIDRFPFSPGDTGESESESKEDEDSNDEEPEFEEPDVEDFNEIFEYGFKVGFDRSIGSRHTLSGAIEPIFTKSDFSLSVDPTGETSPITDSSLDPLRSRIRSFIQDNIAFSERTQLTLGSRFTYIPIQQRLYAEPRLALRHDIPDGPGGTWAFHGAVGLYRQYMFQFDVSDYNRSTLLPGFRFWIPVGKDIRATAAYHAALGILFIPTNEWQIRLEGYYKHQPRLAVLDYVEKDGIRKAEGYAFGGGATIRYEIPLLRLQTSYEYSIAQRRIDNRFDGHFIEVPWHAPHQINTTLDVQITSGLLATIQWEGVFRRTWAYRQAYYDYLEPLSNQDPNDRSFFSSPSQHILRSFSQLDAGISYSTAIGRLNVQAQINVINILDRKNVFDWVIEEAGDFRIRRNRITTPFYSTASIRIRY